MDPFIFSAYVLTSVTKIERRPWWAIFSKDKIIEQEEWTRKEIPLNDYEFDAVLTMLKKEPMRSVFLKTFAGTDIENIREVNVE